MRVKQQLHGSSLSRGKHQTPQSPRRSPGAPGIKRNVMAAPTRELGTRRWHADERGLGLFPLVMSLGLPPRLPGLPVPNFFLRN